MLLWIIELEELEISAKGKITIQKLIKGQEVNIADSGLSKREWNELMSAFGIDDKILK